MRFDPDGKYRFWRNTDEHCHYRPENVGGGLAAQWRRTGHQVTALGRGGRDASGATVAVMAVPGPP